MQLCHPPFRRSRLVCLNLLPSLATLVSAFRISSCRPLVRFYIYASFVTSFLLLHFLVCSCASCWIILDTLLLYFLYGDRLAGTTFILLKCGSVRFARTLSTAMNHCPRGGSSGHATLGRGHLRVLTCNISH